MRGGGHSKVSPFMHQATSMPSCPCFFSFQQTSLHVSHFPRFHLATSLRHHVPTRTTKWLVACTRTLASALVCATSCFRVCLFTFILFLGDLPSCAPPFPRVRCSHHVRTSHGMARLLTRFSSDHTTGLSARRVVFERCRGTPSCPPGPPWVFCVLCVRFIPVSRPHS